MKQRGDDLRPEYDLARLKGGVRGKYHQRLVVGVKRRDNFGMQPVPDLGSVTPFNEG